MGSRVNRSSLPLVALFYNRELRVDLQLLLTFRAFSPLDIFKFPPMVDDATDVNFGEIHHGG